MVLPTRTKLYPDGKEPPNTALSVRTKTSIQYRLRLSKNTTKNIIKIMPKTIGCRRFLPSYAWLFEFF
jgi:hypothetical protein